MNSIRLEQLCITASALREVLQPLAETPKPIETRMYEGAVGIYKRMLGLQTKTNFIMEAGHVKEDEIGRDHFADEWIEKQKICEKVFNVGGVDILFRATLDFFDTRKKIIFETKYAFKVDPLLSGIVKDTRDKDEMFKWVHEGYCPKYDAQAQVQLLCCDEAKGLKFVVCSRLANDRCYRTKLWKRDEFFIERHKKVILRFWDTINDVDQKFCKQDKQVLLDVFQDDEEVIGSMLGNEIQELIKEYIEVDDEVKALEDSIKQKKEEYEKKQVALKEQIVLHMKSEGYNRTKIGRFSVWHKPEKKTYRWDKIVQEKGLEELVLSELDEKEKVAYFKETDEVHTIRISKAKKPFFET